VTQDCDGAGYDQLAGLYIVEGEFAKAIEALKSLRGTPIQKRYRPHYALERRSILADIMYALGKTDDAERLAAEVYGLPERLGMISTPKRHADFIRAFRYWMALDTKIAHAAEKSSYRSFADSWSYDDVTLPFTRWSIRRLLIQLLADDDFLVSITRPNMGELFQHASWRNPMLIEILGTGVMSDTVAEARAADTQFPQATPFYDLFDAEISYRKGDLTAAVDAATAALAKLPKEEAMMRWRTLAWQAEALRRQGRLEAARPLFHEVLQKAPSMLRILDTELPVTISDDGSPLAKEAARRVRHSPRFDATDGAPFKISATSKNGVVELCLTDDGGFSFGCAHGEKNDGDDATVVSALDAFHDAAFTPKIALEQSDLNSLDGSPTRATADHMLKGLVEP
jgi:tetratricopeptide (TPR) repeat protein